MGTAMARVVLVIFMAFLMTTAPLAFGPLSLSPAAAIAGDEADRPAGDTDPIDQGSGDAELGPGESIEPGPEVPTPGQSPDPNPGQPLDPGIDEVDPLSGEAPADDQPDPDVTVPPPDSTGDQRPYQPPEILWSSVVEAERRLEASQQDKAEAVDRARSIRLRVKELAMEQVALDQETRDTIDNLTESTERYRNRAVMDFRLFGSGNVDAVGLTVDPAQSRRVLNERRGARMAAAALDVDDQRLAELDGLRLRLGREVRALLDRIDITTRSLAEAEAAAEAVDREIEQAEIEYEAFRAGSELFIEGIVFPIGGPYAPLIDSYGFPRMVGTPDEHWHEGIDIFAPRGTPLVAAERGVVVRIGVGRLGGLKFWLVGESGAEWYYAHLESFAPGLAEGNVVEAGEVLGYVGNTGNAVGTPPHLHLQLHPEGGDPVNPFPLLDVVSELQQAAIEAGPDQVPVAAADG